MIKKLIDSAMYGLIVCVIVLVLNTISGDHSIDPLTAGVFAGGGYYAGRTKLREVVKRKEKNEKAC